MAVARLDPGVSIEAARQHARAAAERFRAEFPNELQSDATFDVMPLASLVVVRHAVVAPDAIRGCRA